MAHATQATRVGSNLGASWFTSVLESIKQAARRRAVYQQVAGELNECSDRELSDLGLNRSMIRSLAREASLKA